jgi:putative hemolysin
MHRLGFRLQQETRMYWTMSAVICVLPVAGGHAQTPQLANPASVNCIRQGGTLTLESRPDRAQFGVCTFIDNYQCEEWALFRGECPKTGLRVTGFATQAGRYCAITGGRYSITSPPGTAPERGKCSLPNGNSCDADAYYAGVCAQR